VSRLHERKHALTAGAAFGVFGFLGILGFLTRRSERDIRGELCLTGYRAIGVAGHRVPA
jgi:hypothetical protein